MDEQDPNENPHPSEPSDEPAPDTGVDDKHDTDAETEAGRAEQRPGTGDDHDESYQDRLRELVAHTRRSDRQIANPDNLAVAGMMEVITRDRSFRLVLDGDSALRLLARFRTGDRRHEDTLDPAGSADVVWAALDLSEVIGLYWVPSLPDLDRAVVDPAI